MRIVRIRYLTPGERSIPHRAFPDIVLFVPVKTRHSDDMPIRSPENPRQRTDQAGLSHFVEGYRSATVEDPPVRSWEAKMV